jgi:hypothetical protein
MAARATGRVTEIPPTDEDDDDEDEELEDEVDDDELDIEEEEDDDGSPFEPPKPQAGRMAAHASMPTMMTGARRRSSLRSALGFECELGGIERSLSRILRDLQHPSASCAALGSRASPRAHQQ